MTEPGRERQNTTEVASEGRFIVGGIRSGKNVVIQSFSDKMTYLFANLRFSSWLVVRLLGVLGIGMLLLLSGCGGGGGGSSSADERQDPSIRTGTFVDSAVDGARYLTSSGLEGFTREGGQFNYRDGDTVTFFVGDLELGSLRGSDLVSVLSMDEGVKAAQLLQSMDADSVAENGIEISEATHQALENAAYSVEEVDINDPDFNDWLESRDVPRLSINARQAEDHARLSYAKEIISRFNPTIQQYMYDEVVLRTNTDYLTLTPINDNLQSWEKRLSLAIYALYGRPLINRDLELLSSEINRTDRNLEAISQKLQLVADAAALVGTATGAVEDIQEIREIGQIADDAEFVAEASWFGLKFLGDKAYQNAKNKVLGRAFGLKENPSEFEKFIPQIFSECTDTLVDAKKVSGCINNLLVGSSLAVNDVIYGLKAADLIKERNSIVIARAALDLYFANEPGFNGFYLSEPTDDELQDMIKEAGKTYCDVFADSDRLVKCFVWGNPDFYDRDFAVEQFRFHLNWARDVVAAINSAFIERGSKGLYADVDLLEGDFLSVTLSQSEITDSSTELPIGIYNQSGYTLKDLRADFLFEDLDGTRVFTLEKSNLAARTNLYEMVDSGRSLWLQPYQRVLYDITYRLADGRQKQQQGELLLQSSLLVADDIPPLPQILQGALRNETLALQAVNLLQDITPADQHPVYSWSITGGDGVINVTPADERVDLDLSGLVWANGRNQHSLDIRLTATNEAGSKSAYSSVFIVRDPDGQLRLLDGPDVGRLPEVTSVAPLQAAPDQLTTFTVQGRYFPETMTAQIQGADCPTQYKKRISDEIYTLRCRHNQQASLAMTVVDEPGGDLLEGGKLNVSFEAADCPAPNTDNLARILFKQSATAVLDDPGLVTCPYLAAECGGKPYIQFGLGNEVHSGIDYRSSIGHPVFSPVGGDILRTDDDLGVVSVGVDTNGDGEADSQFSFAHLSTIDVQAGTTISAGQRIGESGNKGVSSGPHLHVEYRPNYLNGGLVAGAFDSCGGNDCSKANIEQLTADPVRILEVSPLGCASPESVIIGAANSGQYYRLKVPEDVEGVRYLWSQTTGPALEISTPTADEVLVKVPEINTTEVAEIVLYVTDSEGTEVQYRFELTISPAPLSGPTISSVSGGVQDDGARITLTVRPVEEALSYNIYYQSEGPWAEGPNGPDVQNYGSYQGGTVIAETQPTFQATVDGQNADGFLITEVTPGEHYYLAVTAVTEMGETLPSSQVDVKLTNVTTSPETLRALNDTGISLCQDSNGAYTQCPVTGLPGQDAELGRDALARNGELTKVGAGAAGFDFTKLDNNGNPVSADATSWACVRDNHTGLIWEVKTTDGGLRDRNHNYSWFNSNAQTNGGSPGTENGGTCFSGTSCDTEGYTAAVNRIQLCGYSDWRMPTRLELLSIVHNGRNFSTIDPDYFRSNGGLFWSSSPTSSDSVDAWYVDFRFGNVSSSSKDTGYEVRLVRTGQ